MRSNAVEFTAIDELIDARSGARPGCEPGNICGVAIARLVIPIWAGVCLCVPIAQHSV